MSGFAEPAPTGATRVDVHQHLWTEPLLDALAARNRLPFVTTAGSAAAETLAA